MTEPDHHKLYLFVVTLLELGWLLPQLGCRALVYWLQGCFAIKKKKEESQHPLEWWMEPLETQPRKVVVRFADGTNKGTPPKIPLVPKEKVSDVSFRNRCSSTEAARLMAVWQNSGFARATAGF
eukprot:TRINITY_DN20626_c0_g1_i1.p1 TRINITY_DN20626_c0_g1~~TRINITY_DN20626_c0_g1_i1.p1  ORF type:complete len:124 (+),score=14.84 TRINITY_DN20626_c0_g1_i1:48-419(+)